MSDQMDQASRIVSKGGELGRQRACDVQGCSIIGPKEPDIEGISVMHYSGIMRIVLLRIIGLVRHMKIVNGCIKEKRGLAVLFNPANHARQSLVHGGGHGSGSRE